MATEAAQLRIPEVFAGKSVLITGGSGFLGKVLIEKLLRSCPDLSNVFVLLRAKKGKNPDERIQDIINFPIYDKLREERPEVFSKLKVIPGDTRELGIGLSPEHRALLCNEVHIVYHTAASVRFDDSLREAVLLNTRGTRETILLAHDMTKLELFVHVSTTYCNADRKVVEEKLYPAYADWRTTIRVAEEMDPHVVEVLAAKYLGRQPNTYTFSKQLSEQVVYDLCAGKIQAVVVRPSVVTSSLSEPIPGWVDNLNGNGGIIVGVGKGIIHTIFTEHNHMLNYVPVDVCIKGVIVATWYHLTKCKSSNPENQVEFYNAALSEALSLSTEKLVEMGLDMLLNEEVCTVGTQVWYPAATVTNNKYKFFVQFLFFQLIPALFMDGVLLLLKQKPFLTKIQRKIYIAFIALQYFAFHSFTFFNDKFVSLNEKIPKEDIDSFFFYHEDIDKREFYKNGMITGAKYLLQSDPNDERLKIIQRRLKYLHLFVVYGFYAVVSYWLGCFTVYFLGSFVEQIR